jgi:AhpD family alkylhydroperoxidase
MSRISRLDRSEVAPEIAALYDKAFALRGNVPNMFRVMAHRPEIYATMQAHFAAVLNTGTVSTKLKELIIVRTSQVNETPYCLASHTILARNLGWTDDQLAHLADWSRRDDFTPPKRPPAPRRNRHPRRQRRHRRAVRRAAQLLLRRRDRRAALRHRPLQLLQPLQQRAADGADQSPAKAARLRTRARRNRRTH